LFLLVANLTPWRLESRATAMRQNLPDLKTLRKSKSVGVGVQSKSRLQDIADALIADGYTSLDAQAKALGIHRATAWTIIKTKHKLGRLNACTTRRILENPGTPPSVRAVIEKYLAEEQGFGAPQTQEEQKAYEPD
jgi:hypothetical protein